jgi:beta-galactosidase
MSGVLTLSKLQDRAQVFVDGVLQGVAYRVSPPTTVTIMAKVGSMLTILLENMGRINFSHGMDNENKGILGGVLYGGAAVRCSFSTEIYTRRCHWFPRLLA